ncbi:putative Capsule synthesis protein PGA_cap [Vibrio chagasii]|nr:putative Capsule synthesis protein PGA_cap [Vibrio chagasii]CAH7328819.1 putative Capsule synthesis protein PGA_cap [Vibrio chagasii]
MKILFVGDFFYDFETINQDIFSLGEYVRKNGFIVCLNLEAPIQTDDVLDKWVNLYNNKKTLSSVLDILNVKFVNLSNNHIFDFGVSGYRDLVNILDAKGIIYFGAGESNKEAALPKYFSYQQYKFGFISFGSSQEGCLPSVDSFGTSIINEDTEYNIKVAKEKCDFLIVSLHWGFEFELYPEPVNRKRAQKYIDAGANLIVGHHPHVPQPKEVFKGNSIYYSLGNFYFGSRRNWFYEHCKFDNAKTHSHLGLGVILDLDSLTTTEIEVEYDRGRDFTLFLDKKEIENLSCYSLKQYNKLYRNLYSKRYPALYTYESNYIECYMVKLKLFIFNSILKIKGRLKSYLSI